MPYLCWLLWQEYVDDVQTHHVYDVIPHFFRQLKQLYIRIQRNDKVKMA